mmetsp:Transcript_19913/g.32769  ORF Transcript_19913/g.32769 Transcript_19913/m.32769 type:complete len:442 (+) Transcript_19913:153-1478(+)
MARKYQVVVFGATGFTGQLVAEHLATQYGKSGDVLRWAIAGRSQEKLDKVKEKLAGIVGDWCSKGNSIPVVIADSFDQKSLEAMCADADVIVSTVGPFISYGKPLVKACVKNQTDYLDSTGESTFIYDIINEYQDEAVKNGTRLVPSCGYDSLPSDLGVLNLVQNIQRENPTAEIEEIVHYIGRMKAGISGGTLHTMMTIFGAEDKRVLMKVYGNPNALCPPTYEGIKTPSQRFASYSQAVKKWTAPWLMAGANERVVRRSAALLRYGPQFQFKETMATDGLLPALVVSFGMGMMMFFLAVVPPLRWFLTKYVLPAPSTGPPRKLMDSGHAVSYVHTKSGGKDYLTTVKITKGDVGYKSTGMMLAESAVALAKSRDIDIQIKSSYGGVQTPASCYGLGEQLFSTLERNAGITFEFEKLASGKSLASTVQPYNVFPHKRAKL